MRVGIRAVGRLKAGPERDLVARYVERARQLGPRLGLGPLDIREVPESRAASAAARKAEEAGVLLAGLDPKAHIVALDEGGMSETSAAFADRLARRRNAGCPEIAFLIGGADGLGPEALARAGERIAFGALTWPHQLVRLLLAEQVYRAATILAGHPYHRA